MDVDLAKMATRTFWEKAPAEWESAWSPLLDGYALSTDSWTLVHLPAAPAIVSVLVRTKDSAPGPDGIPYAFWRAYPNPTACTAGGHCRGSPRPTLPSRSLDPEKRRFI